MTKFGTHVRIDLGMVPTYNKMTPPNLRGGGVGILGGKKIKSPGNVMNCPEHQ